MFADRLTALTELTETELDGRIRELELQRRRIDADLAATVAVAEHRGVHLIDGHRSMAAHLRATCNWSNSEVARVRGAARLVDVHPQVGDAMEAGSIGAAQVAELSRVHGNTRVRDRLCEFLPMLLQQAETLPFNEFRVVVQRFAILADADGTHDDRDAIDGRSARAAEVDGSLDVRVSGGDRLTTAEYLAVVERFVEAEFRSGEDARKAAAERGEAVPVRRTRRQLQFDAIIAMSRAAAAHTGIGSAAEPLVSILTDQHTWAWVIARSGLGAATSLDGESIDPFTGLPQSADLLDDLLGDPAWLPHRRCETTNGVPLHPNDVLRAALSGHVRRVVLGAKSVPIDLGRSRRVFSGAARDAAKLLVEWCDHPGCDVPAALCQVDHSTEWSEEGRTDQDNAGVECGGHNRDKHRSKRRTRRAVDGRMYTIRADGTIMLPVGCRSPVFDTDNGTGKDTDGDGDTDGSAPPELSAADELALTVAARNRLTLLTLQHAS